MIFVGVCLLSSNIQALFREGIYVGPIVVRYREYLLPCVRLLTFFFFDSDTQDFNFESDSSLLGTINFSFFVLRVDILGCF